MIAELLWTRARVPPGDAFNSWIALLKVDGSANRGPKHLMAHRMLEKCLALICM